MNSYTEGNLEFQFNSRTLVLPYENSTIHLRRGSGKKAVDFIACTLGDRSYAWYLEAKDFRIITKDPKSSNLSEIHLTFTQKFIDSKEGVHSETKLEESEKVAALAIRNSDVEIALLHMEPNPYNTSYLFPLSWKINMQTKVRNEFHKQSIAVQVFVIDAKRTDDLRAQGTSIPWITILHP